MKFYLRFLLVCPLIFTLSGCQSDSVAINHSAQYSYSAWTTWKQHYQREVSGKDGWLSLAGLCWLEEGINTLGASANKDCQLPQDTPNNLGSLIVNNNQVEFKTNNTDLQVDGNSNINHITLKEDETQVTFPNYGFKIIKRDRGFALRLIDKRPINQEEGLVKFIDFQPEWVMRAKLIPNVSAKTIRLATVYGTTREDKSAGLLIFEYLGKKYQLEAVNYGKDTPMYVMFSDQTNGESTYAAGRYVKVEWPDLDGYTVIDFNRAYNPPCAYTNYATCPLTPKQNVLPISISAGELSFKH